MAIALNAYSSLGYSRGAAVNINLTTSVANCYLLVCIGGRAMTTISVTVDGTAIESTGLKASATSGTTTTGRRAYIYGVLLPSSGAHTISWKNASTTYEGYGISLAFSGMDTSNPFRTITSSATGGSNKSNWLSVGANPVSGDMLVNASGVAPGYLDVDPTVYNGETMKMGASPDGLTYPTGRASYKTMAGGAFTTGYNEQMNVYWAICAVCLKEPSAAPKIPSQAIMFS